MKILMNNQWFIWQNNPIGFSNRQRLLTEPLVYRCRKHIGNKTINMNMHNLVFQCMVMSTFSSGWPPFLHHLEGRQSSGHTWNRNGGYCRHAWQKCGPRRILPHSCHQSRRGSFHLSQDKQRRKWLCVLLECDGSCCCMMLLQNCNSTIHKKLEHPHSQTQSPHFSHHRARRDWGRCPPLGFLSFPEVAERHFCASW